MSAAARATDAAVHRLRVENAQLRAERDRLRAVLEMFADEENWITEPTGVPNTFEPPGTFDQIPFNYARAALAPGADGGAG